MNNNPS